MDFLASILMSVLGGAAGQAGQNLYTRVKRFFHDTFRDQSETNILQALEAIGNLSDSDIRKRVEDLSRLKKLPAEQAEELTALLINLAHGTRFHTTHGTLRSSFVRCETLLDQLLKCVLPKRRKGAPVAENGMPDWKLARFLGMGSFGEVWEARNPAHPEPRAVKFFTSPNALQWIKAEQQTLYQVQRQLPRHPNLVSFLDVALTGKPFPYLVLEYASGGSLEDWILSHEKDRPPLDNRLLIEGIVRGLAQAHEHGIAHRDLKPANILLAVTNQDVLPKIGDFGLGRVETQRADSSAQASQGAVVGTTIYLPPEALQPFVKRTPEQDDVFAVGVIWYQLLVGRLERPPYDFADRLREHLADSQTIRVIERCMAQPARRFKDASELEQAMDALPPVPPWEPPADCFDVQHLVREYLANRL
ncbi:MAG TPA: protein kinase [Gemmataceae bacterium]|nr:protein kinase [Gemmataceae bacterium]